MAANKGLLRETRDTVIAVKTIIDADLPKLWKAVIGLYVVWGSILIGVAGTAIHAGMGK